ncbi:hypothetical protein SCUCBS95973_003377 [Sporothrix curviconia]|uniref:CENP-V/GFA domain-containing protein n=1 Tax=Sporothrix curviconia TaxID=1260050 RepID=A0ABP0BET2_9PEZI
MIYHGNCHCGRYRFDLHVDQHTKATALSLIPTVTCSCTACTKLGCLWHAVGSGQLVDTSLNNKNERKTDIDINNRTVVLDETLPPSPPSPSASPLLQTYRSGLIRYAFCPDCGTGVFGTHVKGPLMGTTLVNLRTLRGLNPFDYAAATLPSSDAAAHPPPAPDSPTGSHGGSHTTPTAGACLCGSVSVELLAPLAGMPLKEDNCSICMRNAWLGACPRRAHVLVRGAAQHTRDYRFGRRRFMGHPFCTTCGAHVFMNVYGPPQDVVDRLPEDKKALVRQNLDVLPVNVRILDRIQQHWGQLQVAQSDDGTAGYEQDVLGIAEHASTVDGKTEGETRI